MSRKQNRQPVAAAHRNASLPAVIDTFVNLMTRQGMGMPNPQNGTQYPLTRLTQNYLLLISLYRNNWIVRKIVDRVAEDMTKAWVNLTSDVTPEAQDRIDRLERRAHIRAKITEGVKWARLFGGAAGLMMIDGIDEDALFEPLDPARIMPGSFKGILVLDRWSGVYPDIELVDDIGDPEFGLPKYYEISDYTRSKSFMVHHSHILRFPGCHLPSWEEQSTTMWGASEIEAAYDELVKRDNASANIAGLIYRANLNIRKIKGLGPTLSLADQQQIADLYATLEAQNQLQNNFSTFAMDADDDFQTIQNTTFTGLNDIYESFMMDVSGATGIPVTLLFGRAPAGMNATGESDLQNYYDMVGQKQETYLRPVLEKLLPIEFLSEFGQVPDDINFQFNSPRSESPAEQADVVQKKATVINDLFTSGLLPQVTALKELQEIGRTTDMFTNIKDEDIAAAEATPQIGDIPGLTDVPQGGIPGITDEAITDADRWITIHGGENAYGESTGRHVEIDEHGNIIGGALPKSAQGKNIRGWWKKESPESKSPETMSVENLVEHFGLWRPSSGPNAGKLGIEKNKDEAQKSISVLSKRKGEIFKYFDDQKKKQEEASANRQKQLEARIPGLSELTSACEKEDAYHAAFASSVYSGSGRIPRKPEVLYEDIAKAYPVAAAYLKAESYANASNDLKASAGQKAMKRLENGENYQTVLKDMESEWSKGASERAWD